MSFISRGIVTAFVIAYPFWMGFATVCCDDILNTFIRVAIIPFWKGVQVIAFPKSHIYGMTIVAYGATDVAFGIFMALAVFTARLGEIITATPIAASLFYTTDISFRTAFLGGEVIALMGKLGCPVPAASFDRVCTASRVSAAGFGRGIATERVIIRVVATLFIG
jgi:hypothetical protein